MHIDVLPLFIFSCLFYLGRSICVPVYIDGVYPTLNKPVLSIAVLSTAQLSTSAIVMQLDTWTAPCSNGLFVTRHECELRLRKHGVKRQSDKSISNYNYGGTCTVVAQSDKTVAHRPCQNAAALGPGP